MLILLPPSEGKAPTDAGSPFALDSLSLSSLEPTRRRVRDAVVKLCKRRESRALQVLGVSARQKGELERNAGLCDARACAASDVYNGVLFSALEYSSLTKAARQRANDWILVSSALWGAVRLEDRIPAYRLSGDVTLPRLGPIPNIWRKPLQQAMPEAATDEVVLDLRSGVYAKMWQPLGELAERTVVGRVVQERPDRSRVVVSHHNKSTKGRLVRDLVSGRARPRTVDDLAGVIERLGYGVELFSPQTGRPRAMDIVVAEL